MFTKWKDNVPIYSLQVSRVSAANIFFMKYELLLNQLNEEGLCSAHRVAFLEKGRPFSLC